MNDSSNLHILIDSLVDNQRMISVQEVFQKCDYDHKKYIDNQEINK